MLNFKKLALTETKILWQLKATPKGSELLPSPHPGYAVAKKIKIFIFKTLVVSFEKDYKVHS